jgi:hypothetical protein
VSLGIERRETCGTGRVIFGVEGRVLELKELFRS